MLNPLRTRIDRFKGLLRQVGVPREVLSAVEAAPVPVGVHELLIGDVGQRGVFAGAAGLEGVGRCGEGRVGECQGDESEELHGGSGWADRTDGYG
jgi:hypothetical protein